MQTVVMRWWPSRRIKPNFAALFSQEFRAPNIKKIDTTVSQFEDQDARRTSKPNFRNFNADTVVQIATDNFIYFRFEEFSRTTAYNNA